MAEKTEQRTAAPAVIAGSFLLFLAGWTLRVLLWNTDGMGEGAAWFAGFVAHTLWWPVFALVFIRRYDGGLLVPLREMFRTPPAWRYLLPAMAGAVLYNVAGRVFGGVEYGTEMVLYDLIVTALTVGLYEELVFRGWFLNAIAAHTGERAANGISAALFLLIHLPGWLHRGYDPGAIAVTGGGIFLLGLLFGWLFRRGRSIWTGAILHSFWDLLTWV